MLFFLLLMKAKPRRWFVLPSGDDINPVISQNFPDAIFHDQIRVEISGKPQTKPAWEVPLESIQQLLDFLRTSRIDGKLLVAVQIEDGKIRMAERDEFDKKFKKIKKRRTATMRAIKGHRDSTFLAFPDAKTSLSNQ